MSKVTKSFSFPFPLIQKVVRNLRLVNEHIGDLTIEGVATLNPNNSILDLQERFEIDIDFVKWNGNDIKPVLELTGLIDDINDAAMQYACKYFTNLKAA